MTGVSTLDITEDLSAAQLAEAAFGEEIVIKLVEPQPDAGCYAIITGAHVDDDEGQYERPSDAISFSADGVDRSDSHAHWVENGETYTNLPREHFVVFGPANREPEHREPPRKEEYIHEVARDVAMRMVGFDPHLGAMLAVFMELNDWQAEHDPRMRVYDVRLDGKGNPREYRVLVRPADPPMFHEEIAYALNLADKYEMQGVMTQAGLEIRYPGDV